MDSTLRLQNNRLQTHIRLAPALAQKRQRWHSRLALLQPESFWYQRLNRFTAFASHRRQHYTHFSIQPHLPFFDSWHPLTFEFLPFLPGQVFPSLLPFATGVDRSPFLKAQSIPPVNLQSAERTIVLPTLASPLKPALPTSERLPAPPHLPTSPPSPSSPSPPFPILRFKPPFLFRTVLLPLAPRTLQSVERTIVLPTSTSLLKPTFFTSGRLPAPVQLPPLPASPSSPSSPSSSLSPSPPSPAPPIPIPTGVALPSELRSRLEPLTGMDLGNVRLHTDSTAASLAFRLHANAFTLGQQIFFAAGKFQPQTQAGLALLMHELTHVRQQPGGQPLPAERLTLTQHQSLERQAQAQEAAIWRGLPASGSRSESFLPTLAGQAIRQPGAAIASSETDLITLAPAENANSTPVFLSLGSRTTAVVPLRQEASATPSSAAAPVPSSPAPASSEPPNPEKLAQQVYELLQRRLRIEREQRGIQQWR